MQASPEKVESIKRAKLIQKAIKSLSLVENNLPDIYSQLLSVLQEFYDDKNISEELKTPVRTAMVEINKKYSPQLSPPTIKELEEFTIPALIEQLRKTKNIRENIREREILKKSISKNLSLLEQLKETERQRGVMGSVRKLLPTSTQPKSESQPTLKARGLQQLREGVKAVKDADPKGLKEKIDTGIGKVEGTEKELSKVVERGMKKLVPSVNPAQSDALVAAALDELRIDRMGNSMGNSMGTQQVNPYAASSASDLLGDVQQEISEERKIAEREKKFSDILQSIQKYVKLAGEEAKKPAFDKSKYEQYRSRAMKSIEAGGDQVELYPEDIDKKLKLQLLTTELKKLKAIHAQSKTKGGYRSRRRTRQRRRRTAKRKTTQRTKKRCKKQSKKQSKKQRNKQRKKLSSRR